MALTNTINVLILIINYSLGLKRIPHFQTTDVPPWARPCKPAELVGPLCACKAAPSAGTSWGAWLGH